MREGGTERGSLGDRCLGERKWWERESDVRGDPVSDGEGRGHTGDWVCREKKRLAPPLDYAVHVCTHIYTVHTFHTRVHVHVSTCMHGHA